MRLFHLRHFAIAMPHISCDIKNIRRSSNSCHAAIAAEIGGVVADAASLATLLPVTCRREHFIRWRDADDKALPPSLIAAISRP